MLPYRDSRLTQIALGLFFVAVLAYAYFEVRGLLYGPHIIIDSSMTEVHDRYVVVSGHTDHIASLNVNGTAVSLTTEGSFEVPYLLAPGVNTVVFDARDSYGGTTSRTVQIVYIPDDTSTSTPTTTTATSTTPATSIHATTTSQRQGVSTKLPTSTTTEPTFVASTTPTVQGH